MDISRLALLLLRIAAGVQVVLGIGFWTGHWTQAIPVHRTIGMVFVLLLWIIAVVALARRANIGLAVFAIVWGLVIAGFGFSQQHILVGSGHWIVRVAHLVIALSAMPIAERLARARSPNVAAV
jgi:hypothetical protein